MTDNVEFGHNYNQPTSSSAEPLTSPGPAVMFLQPLPTQTNIESYAAKQSVGLGIAQILIGVLCIIFNSVAVGLSDAFWIFGTAAVGHGIWTGVLFIVTGSFGCVAGRQKTKCKIVTYLVLCIISACFTSALLSAGILGACVAGFAPYRCRDNDYGYSYNYDYYYRPPCAGYVAAYRTVVAMEICMAVSGFIALILFIWASALCCKASCKYCCCNDATPQVFAVAYNVPNGGAAIGLQSAAVYQLPVMPCQSGFVPTAPPPYQLNYPVQPWINVPAMPMSAASAYSTDAPDKSVDGYGYQKVPQY